MSLVVKVYRNNPSPSRAALLHPRSYEPTPTQVIMPLNGHGGRVESQRILSGYRPIPRCHSVQVGDPHKQPPMLVCR
jgi:hypothetical protein